MNNTDLGLRQLREANVRRCERVFHKLDEWSPCDWATAMAGECGEACNVIKKLRRLDGADASKDSPAYREGLLKDAAYELADLIIYADLLAARLGIDLAAAVTNKFNAVSDVRRSDVTLPALFGAKRTVL